MAALTAQHSVMFFFGPSLSLAEPLPLGAFQPASTDVFVGGVQRFDGAGPGASVELPEPAGGGGAVAAFAMLIAAIVEKHQLERER